MKRKTFKDLLKDLLNGDFELKDVDFSSSKLDKTFENLEKRIEEMDKEYDVDWEDLKNIRFKPKGQ